ncbi:MAG: transcriptional regulator [Gammaproteobacteria bacterium]|nr:MAG: transcriptional regulator [Gammaproteobacteria bacterium]
MITCDQHDYIEIVCTFKYPVKLTMKDGSVKECVPIDTMYDSNRNECMKVDQDGRESLVILDDISRLEVCVDNPHFQRVSFD